MNLNRVLKAVLCSHLAGNCLSWILSWSVACGVTLNLLRTSSQEHLAHISRPCWCQQVIIQERPSSTNVMLSSSEEVTVWNTFLCQLVENVIHVSRVLEFVCD